MIDFDAIEGFEWDDGNVRKSEQKHGINPGECEQVFLHRPLIVAEDMSHSQDEPRFNALGRSALNRLLHLTFTLRAEGKLIRIISARDMNRKERKLYGDGAQENP